MKHFLMMAAVVALGACGEGADGTEQPDEPCNKVGCPSEGQDCKRYRDGKGDAQVTYYLCVDVLPLGAECEHRDDCAGSNNCNSIEGGSVGQRYCTDSCNPDKPDSCEPGFWCHPSALHSAGTCFPDDAI